MTYDSQKYHRRSIRLKGYDYSQAGAYFITVCAQDRACLFGEMAGNQMRLNEAGRMILNEWNSLPVRFPTVELDEFGIMPNHVHGIIAIATADPKTSAGVNDNVGAGLVPAPVVPTFRIDVATPPRATTRVAPTDGGVGPIEQATVVPPPTLGDIVGAFKSLTTDLYIHGVRQSGWPPFRGRLWHRNYHEHIIRNERSLNRVRQYILDNPANWASDPENPQAVSEVKTA